MKAGVIEKAEKYWRGDIVHCPLSLLMQALHLPLTRLLGMDN